MEADESVYGVIDMAGNVREICGEPMGDGRVVRGGDWVTNVPDYFRASHGARVSRAVTGGQTGFRVVKVPK
jgi:formylglycine-generating enzyme required for sulfatase activity